MPAIGKSRADTVDRNRVRCLSVMSIRRWEFEFPAPRALSTVVALELDENALEEMRFFFSFPNCLDNLLEKECLVINYIHS